MNILEVTNLNSENLRLYSLTSEVQLLRYNEPKPGLFIAESAKVIMRAMEKGYKPVSVLVDNALLDNYEIKQMFDILPKEQDFTIYTADNSILKSITGFNLTRGVLSIMQRRNEKAADEILAGSQKIAVLDDVENPTNLGAIFRSAAAMGLDAVLLTKGCSDPLYRRAIRVSMGTVFNIPWAFIPEDEFYPEYLKRQGFETLAMALKSDSIPISDLRLREYEKIAIVLGNEGMGLSDKIIDACTHRVIIPMYNAVDSLNVAAASAVAFWELRRK